MFDNLVGKAFDLLFARVSEVRKAKDEQRTLVQQVQAACDTRAVFTAVHAQLDLEAIFAALVATRRKLQELKSRFTDPAQQQRVADIIGELDSIERERKNLPQNWDAGQQRINAGKTRIIQSVKLLSEAANLPYALPPKLTQELFWEVEQAVAQASREQQ
ncbi:MAG: hypothetical protein ACLQVJ_13840 [Syntrophobacteraceae bacterium]